MSVRTDQRIATLAGAQHGVVTRRQLLEAGITPKAVERRVAAGALLPLHRGVYLLGALRGRLEPERARLTAAVLACGATAAASHASAGRLWKLIRGSGSTATVHVSVVDGLRRRRPGITVHRPADLTRADLTRVDGVPVTEPGRTLRDLSTVLDVKALNRAAARAEREGLIDAAAFPDLVARHGGRVGAPVLRSALLGEGDVIMTRSEAEERLLALVLDHALPRPRVNDRVAGFEVDFHWPNEKLIVEVDGFAHHRSRASFEGDRQRDLDLGARGYTVLRVTWRQLTEEPRGTAGRISRAFGRAEATAALAPARGAHPRRG